MAFRIYEGYQGDPQDSRLQFIPDESSTVVYHPGTHLPYIAIWHRENNVEIVRLGDGQRISEDGQTVEAQRRVLGILGPRGIYERSEQTQRGTWHIVIEHVIQNAN